jgi:hypothetical protein
MSGNELDEALTEKRSDPEYRRKNDGGTGEKRPNRNTRQIPLRRREAILTSSEMILFSSA